MNTKVRDNVILGVCLIIAIAVIVSPGRIIAASDNKVSYIRSLPNLSQDIRLEEVTITTVPAIPIENAEDVLAFGGGSPIFAGCVGANISGGTFVCSEFDERENVSEGTGVTFSKFCAVRIITATYPAFFRGGDRNGDGRIDIYQGEWPSISDVSGRNTPGYIMMGGETIPDSHYHRSVSTDFIPHGAPGYRINPQEKTEVDANIIASGQNVELQGSNDPVTMAIGDCTENPIHQVRTECDSVVKAYNEWESPWWRIPSTVSSLSRPIVDESVCPKVDLVRYQYACFNPVNAAASWSFQFLGELADIACRLTNTCYEDVHLMVWTDTMFGKNTGCVEPCGDMHTDAMDVGQKIPDPSRNSLCSRNEVGQNAPCSPDMYVGTRGTCVVCGKRVPCTYVWKNWLYSEYNRLKAESPPCDPSKGDAFCTFEDSDYTKNGVIDQGYFNYVIENSGGWPAR